MRIILASTSPRRRELIKRIAPEYEAIASTVDEQAVEEEVVKNCAGLSESELAERMVRTLSAKKALSVFESLEDKEDVLVIGADTVVCLSGEILGKPRDREDAVRMLRAQSMEPQQVITGVSLILNACAPECCSGCRACSSGGTEIRTFTEKTLVYFHPLDDAQEARIQAYCDTAEPYDKAGAYGIQQNGNSLVERYEGDFDNIVGFPVARIKKEILELTGCNCNKLT